ncbi:hypothetical protein KIN20_009439 [Parelaphostrongylus tenuis]|uniref:Uncharacterized protein n=1 Tax=Parelaphostrongylus tenuis TaxID=148309 RepID=A0AAD5MQI5_PARTN|nr:hypothetical protein KIN20_009439 [Parelaphostrongylus tenuis]
MADTGHFLHLNSIYLIRKLGNSGEYRACDHDFRAGNGSIQIIEADPDMNPVAPFFIRSKPEITWYGLQFDEEFTVAIIDVLHNYEPSENFRPEPNPMAVLVFGTAKAALKLDSPDDFDISKFMLENDLADDLIGLSLVIVGSDAFAIERQRLRGNIDNCHSLLRNTNPLQVFNSMYMKELTPNQQITACHVIKFPNIAVTTVDRSWSMKKTELVRHPPAHALTRLPLDELNSWLTVSVIQPPLDVNVCCQSVRQNEATIYFDPLGAATISALSTLQPPAVNSARIPIESPSYVSYHRQTRTQIALLDKLYSLVAIDGTTSMLHWMVVDIPAQELASSANGITALKYVKPQGFRLYSIPNILQVRTRNKLSSTQDVKTVPVNSIST